MLLDLGRNDVGRVAKIGTVNVTEQMVIENYSHVMHIVSNVEGAIDDRFDAMDALCGAFPAGTVSGAPKVRAMEIIDELEPEKRGVYAGAIGYFSANGSMDTCIALRTAVVMDGTMYVQAGGGIVADSDPNAEFEESRNKAKALIRAAEEAVRFRGGTRSQQETKGNHRQKLTLGRVSGLSTGKADVHVKYRWNGVFPQSIEMLVIIDNYDSFTYNLVHFLGELGADFPRLSQRRGDAARRPRP